MPVLRRKTQKAGTLSRVPALPSENSEREGGVSELAAIAAFHKYLRLGAPYAAVVVGACRHHIRRSTDGSKSTADCGLQKAVVHFESEVDGVVPFAVIGVSDPAWDGRRQRPSQLRVEATLDCALYRIDIHHGLDPSAHAARL